MNNHVSRAFTLTEQFQPLSQQTEVCSFELSAPPTNSGNVILLGDNGSEVPLVPGEWHEFLRVNLASLRVKGTPGDIVTVVGGTW